MKKKYVNPVTEFYTSELSNVVCASNTYNVGANANWGAGNDPYSNPEWDDEGHGGNTIGGYDTDPIGNDDGTIDSRAKQWDLWDDGGIW